MVKFILLNLPSLVDHLHDLFDGHRGSTPFFHPHGGSELYATKGEALAFVSFLANLKIRIQN